MRVLLEGECLQIRIWEGQVRDPEAHLAPLPQQQQLPGWHLALYQGVSSNLAPDSEDAGRARGLYGSDDPLDPGIPASQYRQQTFPRYSS